MEYDAWYDQPKWKRVRKSALMRDRYMDKEKARFGIFRPAEVVHHIFPKNEFPEYAFELWNLISLSRKTHMQMHHQETMELTEMGKDLLRRTARKNKIPIPDKYKEPKKEFNRGRHNGYYS